MNQDLKDTQQEQEYLNSTLSFIKGQLESEYDQAYSKEEKLISYRREMYENASHHSQDFNKLSETVQYLNPLAMQTMDFEAVKQRISLYEKMLQTPYFARVDFETSRWGKEPIYIGLGNLDNEDTFENYVYDWRAPIASIFYRFEIGKAFYEAPAGKMEGEITLKRQFEIKNGSLDYFFDSSVNIIDDVLKDALSKNTSPKMRTIVETIQREQDIIIRDIDSDLLIVQGVAGSGKTSIALHRAAYLMYEGLSGHLKYSNMILISPNNLFAQYISDVLPELGEQNIDTVTFEKLFFQYYPDDIPFMRRNAMLEEILTADEDKRNLLQDTFRFKSSPVFSELLNRLIGHYQRNMIPFADVLYDGKTIFIKELLKARFLSTNSRSLPVQVRLKHLESTISDKIKQMRPHRLKKIEDRIAEKPERMLDFKTAARLANTKQVSRIMKSVRTFTRVNYRQLYQSLFSKPSLFKSLSVGLDLPDNIDDIMALSHRRLSAGTIDYSDAMALLLLKLRMDSSNENPDIRQVVVDEAQDYSPVHFEILSRLFPSAKYTVLGDINQSIVTIDNEGIYSSAQKLLKKRKNTMVSLNKSFRCSYEISTFASQFSDKNIQIEQLNRFEKEPTIIRKDKEETLMEALLLQLTQWAAEGFKTIAVVCKSAKEAKKLYEKISHRWDIKLFTSDEAAPLSGTVLLPVYLAKGLEFDAVAVYGTDSANYYSQDDRRLLYISSTRALHRLALFHTNELSRLIAPLAEAN